MLPLSSFPDTSRLERPEIWVMAGGRLPVKEFWDKSKLASDIRFPKIAGTLPLNWLKDTSLPIKENKAKGGEGFTAHWT